MGSHDLVHPAKSLESGLRLRFGDVPQELLFSAEDRFFGLKDTA